MAHSFLLCKTFEPNNFRPFGYYAVQKFQKVVFELKNFSVERALGRAKSHAKKGQITEAMQLYSLILTEFPNNKKARHGLNSMINSHLTSTIYIPPQEQIDKLLDLFNKRLFGRAIERAQNLIQQYPTSYMLWNILGASYKSLGRSAEAIDAFVKVTHYNPQYADGFNNLGVVLGETGQFDRASVAYNQALKIKPNFYEAYNNLGTVLRKQGYLEDCIECYAKAIDLKPNYVEAHNNLGVALVAQGKLEDAISAYRRVLSMKPDFAATYPNLVNALQILGSIADAVEVCKQALSCHFEDFSVYNSLGNLLVGMDQLDNAINAYNLALVINPECVDAYSNLATAFVYRGDLEAAIDACNKALNINPNHAIAHMTQGNAFRDQYRHSEALDAYQRAIALQPELSEAYSNMGMVLVAEGKLDAAIDSYNKALSIKPNDAESHSNLSYALLNIGRIKDGLNEYEWRHETRNGMKHKREFSKPMWDGQETLRGKRILLWSEQGVGDTINWSSCLSAISSKADQCILECPEKLVPLLARSFPNIEIKSQDRSLDKKRDDFDFHLPLGSLYKHFIEEVYANRRSSAFLIPDSKRKKFWRERLASLGSGPYIGVSWKSGDMSPARLQNYAQISEWYPIFKIRDVTYINLQYSDFENDLQEIKDSFGTTVHNFDDLDHYNDLDEVAALCSALDMVISTKITVPLISAAVGTPTKLAIWRQSTWNNILLNPAGPYLEMFERNTLEPWNKAFEFIQNDVLKLKHQFAILGGV